MPWPIAPSRPCLLSCICYAPHSWEKCWHLVGLPEREMTHHCKEFQSLSARGDAKSAAGSLGARIASSLPGTCSTTSNLHATPCFCLWILFLPPSPSPVIPVVDSDVDDVHRPAPCCFRRVATFSIIACPSVFSLVAPSDDALAIATPSGLFSPSLVAPSDDALAIATPSDVPDSIPDDEDILLTVPLDDPHLDPIPPIQPPLGLSLLFLLPLVMSGGMWILVQLLFAPINFLTSFWHPYLPTCQWALLTRWQHLQLKPWAPSPSLALIVMVIIFINQSHRFLGCLALPGNLLVFKEGLRSLGYTCIHSAGEYLRLIHQPTGVEYDFPVYTLHGNTDFVALKVNVMPEIPSGLRVSALNIATQLKGAALFYLLHFCLGCLSPSVLERIIKSGAIHDGVPPNLCAPPDFQCPICLLTGVQVPNSCLARNPAQALIILTKGACFHADFLFLKVASIRGFVAMILLLICLETSHGWIFLRCSKHLPIQLLVWFIHHTRLRLQYSMSVLCTDGGGELYGSLELRLALAQLHVQMETTGGYNAAAS
jgi:hypothetical protein